MERRDAEHAVKYNVPEKTLAETPDAYRNASIDCIVDYAKAQFRYWTEDGFAAPFRKMLTLEQYGSAEMGRLYQQYLVSGPLGYMADLFAALNFPQPQEEAVKFYAPMFLLYGVYDGAKDKRSTLSMTDSLLENARKRLKGANTECG